MRSNFSSFKDLLNFYELCPFCFGKPKRLNYYFDNFSQTSVNNGELLGKKTDLNTTIHSPEFIKINYNQGTVETLDKDSNQMDWREKLHLTCPRMHFVFCVSVISFKASSQIDFLPEYISITFAKNNNHFRFSNSYALNKLSILVNGYQFMETEAIDLSNLNRQGVIDLTESMLII